MDWPQIEQRYKALLAATYEGGQEVFLPPKPQEPESWRVFFAQDCEATNVLCAQLAQGRMQPITDRLRTHLFWRLYWGWLMSLMFAQSYAPPEVMPLPYLDQWLMVDSWLPVGAIVIPPLAAEFSRNPKNPPSF